MDVKQISKMDQLYSRLKAGIQVQYTPCSSLYDEKAWDGWGVLLVDARNAFNSVNKPPCGMPELSGQGLHVSYNLIQHLSRICFLGVAWNLRIHTQQTQMRPPQASEAGSWGGLGRPTFSVSF